VPAPQTPRGSLRSGLRMIFFYFDRQCIANYISRRRTSDFFFGTSVSILIMYFLYTRITIVFCLVRLRPSWGFAGSSRCADLRCAKDSHRKLELQIDIY
jgi:hypothetical protein